MPFVITWMDLEIIKLSEISQTKTNIIPYHLFVESKKKNDTNALIYKTEQNRLTDIENKVMITEGDSVEGGDKLGVQNQQIQTATYKLEKQEEATMQHRELYSISRNNL